MGTRITDAVASADRQRTTITMDVSNTSIVSLSIIDLTGLGQPNDTWAEVGVMSGGNLQANRVSTLAAGYTGPGAVISWAGHLHLDNEAYLYADVYSSSGGTFRLAAMTGRPQTENQPTEAPVV